MISNILFNLSKPEIYKNFFLTIGFIPLNVDNENQEKSFYTGIEYLIKKENKYKLLPLQHNMEVVFSLIKVRVGLLNQEYDIAKLCLNHARQHIYKIENDSPIKDIFIYIENVLSIELNNIAFFDAAEKKLSVIKNKIDSNRNEIENIIKQYDTVELNSPKHLDLSYKHLEFVVENTKLTTNNFIEAEESLMLEGRSLLFKVEQLIEKLKNNKFIILKDALIQTETNLKYNSLIYSKLLSEKIKLKFYLGQDKKSLFDEVGQFVKQQINLSVTDPLGILLNNLGSSHIYSISPYNNHKIYNAYVKSYILELQKNLNKTITYQLKQLSNFEAQTEAERLKIHEV